VYVWDSFKYLKICVFVIDVLRVYRTSNNELSS